MTSVDVSAFCSYLQNFSGTKVIPYWISNPDSMDVLSDLLEGRADFFHYWIWNSDASPQPKLDYIKQQKKWTLDRDHSEVIQLGLCHVERGIMRKGRLWVDFSGLVVDCGKERKKSAEFERWYLRLVKWIKKEGEMISAGVYALPDALQSGLKLS